MVGNDIVDIAQAQKDSNWQRPRFLDKLFTEKEQEFIKNSGDKTITVWQLWSMKEAAYKLYVQKHPSRFYAPKQFECVAHASIWKVNYKEFSCYLSIKKTTDYIVSEARLIPHKMTSELVVFKDENLKSQRQVLRDKLSERISKSDNIWTNTIEFQKSEFGIPTVKFDSKIMNLSLTHHGRFGAFAF
ncbi:phosphopantetheine--protein transferase-like protein [Winogradskyella wandonensis]|uniref:Phosphopantetheine--protein transferase-like protein n=1 Tax=Winogradskyella wandonensis TaxID=1442586 RepID=A0A4R1KS67_9FLAO|nr:4'-phosphopantetheinyl transferase superfamily protein [Winogradskyella wandonensis]TCK67895.1 phosphopantetheine--protein transferase-like protein [Winogradskyella wandonensis]